MRSYDMGNEELDDRIRQLVADGSANPNADLIAEIVTSALKLHRDDQTRGELKLINTALKEMRYSNLVFARHGEPKVTIYGSARLAPDNPDYQLATELAAKMAARGWGVITGAGPGIMEAGNLGATTDSSYGVNIRLPFEASSNEHIAPERNVNFKYFFTRKLAFVKESHAFAIFPGGFGTLDEAFELLTLIQTGKSDLHPIVFVDARGTGYWDPLITFIEDVLIAKGLISPHDTNLFLHTHDADEAVDEMCSFYANYQSQRYVDGRLVLRMHHAPDAALLESLNEEFADIVVSGSIESIAPTPAEMRDDDSLDLERIAFHFDRRNFGRLRTLIDRLNTLVEKPDTVTAPPPFRSEQADRDW